MDDNKVDDDRRRFLTVAASVVGGAGAATAAAPFVASFQPSARAQALGAPVEVNIDKLETGQLVTEKWRGKPVWILRRSKEDLQALSTNKEWLLDPDSSEPQQPPYAKNDFRSIKPEYLVVVGLCTHLGCSPKYVPANENHDLGPDWKGGFFCPCHGSRFDLAGRVAAGVPAPANLLVPPHHYTADNHIIIGDDKEKAS